MEITEKGVYENYLIDHEFGSVSEVVRIKADGAVLRNCEIRNGLRDAIGVHAADVLIENCKIHHFLAGTFKEQVDAHGITGNPVRLTIRNCEIYYVSGDCVQFDPGRRPWTDVLIENCSFWTGPLPANAAGFKKGEQPGENAVDTKQLAANSRSRIVMRNCLFYGFKQGGQIENQAALNLKNNIDAVVDNCAFWDNAICLRLRGEGQPNASKFGGARVAVRNCYFYRSDVAIRYEDGIADLKISNPAFADSVSVKLKKAGRQETPGFEMAGERQAPPLNDLLKVAAAAPAAETPPPTKTAADKEKPAPAPANAPPAQEGRVKGVIKSVDAEKGVLTVTVGKNERQYQINPETKLTKAPEGKSIRNRLKDPVFKPGAEVAVTTAIKEGKELCILVRVYP